MKEVKILNTLKVAQVDDEDFEKVSQHTWHLTNKNYPCFCKRVDGKLVTTKLHQFVLGSRNLADHIDTNPLNNQKSNLRFCNQSQNRMNSRKLARHHWSKYKGVTWMSTKGCWKAQLKLNKKTIYIGIFKTEEEAARAYDKYALEVFKEFANLNFK